MQLGERKFTEATVVINTISALVQGGLDFKSN